MLKDLSEKQPSTHSLTSAAVLQHHLGDAHDIYQVVPWPLRARAMCDPHPTYFATHTSFADSELASGADTKYAATPC